MNRGMNFADVKAALESVGIKLPLSQTEPVSSSHLGAPPNHVLLSERDMFADCCIVKLRRHDLEASQFVGIVKAGEKAYALQ